MVMSGAVFTNCMDLHIVHLSPKLYPIDPTDNIPLNYLLHLAYILF